MIAYQRKLPEVKLHSSKVIKLSGMMLLQDTNTAPDGIWAGPNVLSRDVATVAKRMKVRALPCTPPHPTADNCSGVSVHGGGKHSFLDWLTRLDPIAQARV